MQCPRCGNAINPADVFCGNCAFPLREPANMVQTTETGPTFCEIKLNYLNYNPNCSEIASDSCTSCGRAFCESHRGYSGIDGFGKPYFNLDSPYYHMCEPCSTAKQEEERERQYAPMAYFQFGTALTTLRNSRVQSVKIYQVTRWTEEKFLGTIKRKSATLYGRGWVLGKFKWSLSVPAGYGEYKTVDEDWLAALMDNDKLSYSSTEIFGLVRVQPYSDGYEALARRGGLAGGMTGLELAGQAVRKLAGVSS